MKKIGVSLLLAGALAANSGAWAFKPEKHFQYLYRAADALARCHTPPRIAPVLIGMAAMGAHNEDEKSLERLVNWHYVASDRRPGRLILDQVVYSDMSHIFVARSEAVRAAVVQQDCSAAEVFEKTGRVVHFLQDTRVPAHLMPIHHTSVEPFDSHDFGYDDSDGRIDCAVVEKTANEIAASTVAPKTFVARIEQLRKETEASARTWLKEEKLRSTGCTGEQLFWCNPEVNKCKGRAFKGFGSYLTYPTGHPKAGQTIVFGVPGALWCRDAPTPVVGESDYKEYFRKSYEGMLRDTAAMLAAAAIMTKSCK